MKIFTFLRISLFTAFLFAVGSLSAQYNFSFEIRCSKVTSSRLAVDMRVTSVDTPTTAMQVTDIVFGIKWDNNADADLSNSIDNSFGYHISKSDVEKLKSGFEFQAFYANNTPYHFPNDWHTNMWETLCEMDVTINNTGGAPWDFEICELGFDPTTDPNINVDLIDDWTPVPNGVAPLVIKLLEFNAYRSGDRSARLAWTAIVDEHADYFDIERSTNGILWEQAGSQPILIKNKYIHKFYFTDKDVYSPEGDVQMFYYRLKMVNDDGSYSYSDIRQVRFDNRFISDDAKARVYPNPAGQLLQVELSKRAEDYSSLELTITKTTGQSMLKRSYQTEVPGVISLDVGELPAGMYILHLQSDLDEQSIPVVIVH